MNSATHTRKRLLYTGASGKLAVSLLPTLAERFEVTALANRSAIPAGNWRLIRADLTEAVPQQLIEQTQPDIIVNTAALSTDRQCHTDPVAARQINTEVPEKIARACSDHNIALVHFSTDQVYDGSKGQYSEQDLAEPLNCYGRSKLDGEQSVLQHHDRAVVLRLALTFGLAKHGALPFSHSLINQLRAGDTANLFEDEFRSVLYVPDLARLLVELTTLAGHMPAGVYNIGGAQRVNRVEFGRMICREFGFSDKLINPVRSAELSFPEPRPADCSMSLDKILSVVNWRPLPLNRTIADMHVQYRAGDY